MRIIFLLMLFANLALAGWWSYGRYYALESTTPAGLVTTQPSSSARLRLLQELPAEERQRLLTPEQAQTAEAQAEGRARTVAGESAGDAVAQSANSRCYRVDNIVRKDERDALATKIAAHNVTVLDQGEAFHERKVYWVHIPPLKSAAAAGNVVAALNKAKVRDFFLVRAGDARNAISLGLFTQREGAESRLQEIEALKLDIPRPTMRERNSTVRNYWLMAKDSSTGEMVLQKLLESEKRPAAVVECPP